MSKTTEKIVAPAYGSFKTAISFADELRDDLKHMPSRIDRTLMRKLSGSASTELIATLKYWGLIDGEKAEPTTLFEEFAMASNEARKPILEKIVRKAYAFLLESPGLNIERATTQQVQEIFRTQNISGSTLTRAMSLFIAAAKQAEMKISPSIKPPPKPASSNGSRVKKDKKAEMADLAGHEGDDEEEDDEKDELPAHTHRFEIPIPLKSSVQVIVPDDMDAQDWDMLSKMFAIYVERWKGFKAPAPVATPAAGTKSSEAKP
jgi:hypothetical protein